MTDQIETMSHDEALQRAREVIGRLRERAPWAGKYSDAQLWAAMIEAKSTIPDMVALAIFDHIMRGETVPSAEYLH